MNHVDLTNVYELLLLSDLFDSYRLREYCLNYLAKFLDEVWETEEFREFVMRKASPQMEQLLKEAIEDHLVHYGQKFRWLEIEANWNQTFNKEE
jgi:hypothetical protein